MTEFLRKITKSDIRNILAIVTIVGLFVLLYLMMLKPIPKGNESTINIGFGTLLGGLVGGVAGFYFGASKNDTKKEDDV